MRIVVDTREQSPWVFPPGYPTVRKALAVGDYAVSGKERALSIERKAVADMAGCMVEPGYGRFMTEVARARSLDIPLVVVVDGSMTQVADEIRRWLPNVDAYTTVAKFTYNMQLTPVFTNGPVQAMRFALRLLRMV